MTFVTALFVDASACFVLFISGLLQNRRVLTEETQRFVFDRGLRVPSRKNKGGGHPGGHHGLQQRAGGLPRRPRHRSHGQLGGRLAQNPRIPHLLRQHQRCGFHRAGDQNQRRPGNTNFTGVFIWETTNRRKQPNFLERFQGFQGL